jgi:UDP-N-acetylglucosamine--N-acetylmuramyl-(pentapeptide) pyrophosphoryl-undecaprenol N-acetylglucosamine transferase
MKIVLTGGGTGGHFYPIIAVAEGIRDVIKEEKLLDPTLFYAGTEKYDERALFETGLIFKPISAGKARRYFSLQDIPDALRTIVGIFESLVFLFREYPDVVFSKGGYVSFPVVFAARILRIPVVIHESDSVAGRVNAWSAKFAEKIAVSYGEVGKLFPKEKIALTGNPIRKALIEPSQNDARSFLKIDAHTPVLLVLGGSQGSEIINQTITDMLTKILEQYYVIHQTGDDNIDVVRSTTQSLLKDHPFKDRYRPFAHLTGSAMRMVAECSDLVITRAGSTLFEIALWGKPSIIIPIPSDISHDQEKNAFAYARSGAGTVISQSNFNDDILFAEIERIMKNPSVYQAMSKATEHFAYPDAAKKIARALIAIGLRHER